MADRILLALLAILSSTPALAAMRKGSWESEDEVTRTRFGGQAGIEKGFGAGFRFGYVATPEHQVEIELQIMETKDALSPGSEVRLGAMTLGYVHNLRAQTDLVPFFTVGLGLERMDASVLSPRSRLPGRQTSLLTFVGGGVRFFFSPRFNLRFDGALRAVDSDPTMRLDFRGGVGAGWLLGRSAMP